MDKVVEAGCSAFLTFDYEKEYHPITLSGKGMEEK